MLRLYKSRDIFSSHPDQTGSHLLKARSQYSRNNIFCINTSSWDEKCPVLINFSFYNNICLTFLRNSQPGLLKKEFFRLNHIKKYLCMKSQQETKLLPNAFSSDTIMYSGHFLKNLRDVDYSKVSMPLFFW